MAKTSKVSKDKKVVAKTDKAAKVAKPSKEESKKSSKVKKQEKKKVESSSESESESESESSSSSSSESESEKEEAKKEESSDSESSDSESESEEEKPVAKKSAKKEVAKKEVAKKEESSDPESSDSDSDSEEEEEKKEASASSDDSSDSGSDSDSSSSSEDEEEEEEKEEKDSKKRKVEEEAAPAKKQKVEEAAPSADSEPTTLFVGRLSWSIDDDWLKSEFEPLGGVISARVIMERATGKSRGYGYVDFSSKAAAEKALKEYQGREIDGRPINLDLSTGKQHTANNRNNDRASKFGDTPSEPSDTLFLGNLSFNANRDVLFNTFSEHGSVVSVRVPTHPDTEQPKGFGYVQFSSIDEAKGALEALNGEYIEGRPVRLDYSAPRDNSNRKPFGGNQGGNQGGRDRKPFGGNQGGRDRSFTPTGSNRAPVTAEFKGNKKTFD
jgi:nucleolin